MPLFMTESGEAEYKLCRGEMAPFTPIESLRGQSSGVNWITAHKTPECYIGQAEAVLGEFNKNACARA